MSKTKKSGAKHYEILFIVPNKFTEEEAKQVIAKVEGIITTGGGKITYSEYWGKKKLAYEIKHNAYGYYALFEFDLEGSLLAKINQDLRLSTDVLRHQIVSKRVKSEEELKRAQEIQAKIEARKAKEKKEQTTQDEEVLNKKKETSEETAPKSTAKEKVASVDDLDDKLEGILSAKDLM
ncbi:MAG: 30S ribosomal protein S6 [Patescibacteria group bacterium]|jgi:small subunit ribosomal protein S6